MQIHLVVTTTPRLVRLSAADAAAVTAHLLRLDVQARALRFAAGAVSDTTVRHYVGGMRFEHDAVLGALDLDGTLVGLAHGCVFNTGGALHIEAAFSVDAAHRRRGLGSRLMRAIEAHGRHIGAHTVLGLCAARNLPMRRIFEHAGMVLTRHDDELEARRVLGVPLAAQLL
jgi:GNAT superfamily N-acetyltransferase